MAIKEELAAKLAAQMAQTFAGEIYGDDGPELDCDVDELAANQEMVMTKGIRRCRGALLLLVGLLLTAFPVTGSAVYGQESELGQESDFGEMPDLEFEEFNLEDGVPDQVEPSGAVVAGILICYGLFILAAIAVQIWVIYLFYKAAAAVPEQFRELQPGLVWLMLVPIANLVMLFLVGIKIPQSYRNYFHSVGRTDVGDCGESLGLWMAITALIPCVNLASLVLMIMLLMKLFELKKQIGPAKAY